MRNFMKTEGLSPELFRFGCCVKVSEDPKHMPRPGDPDWVDPKTLPIGEVQDLVRELMRGEGHGNPDWYRSEKYDYDLDNRDWEVLFARLGMRFAFSTEEA